MEDFYFEDDDWDDDLNDPMDGAWIRLRKIRKDITCKYCGKGGFKWIQLTGGWRLIKAGDKEVHACR